MTAESEKDTPRTLREMYTYARAEGNGRSESIWRALLARAIAPFIVEVDEVANEIPDR